MRWIVIGVAAALVGLLAYGVASQGTDTTIDSAVQSGKKVAAPEGSLPVLGSPSDETAAIGDYKGKVVLVNFWASWCEPCTDELPLLEETQELMQAGGGTVLGVNTRDATEDALGFVNRFDLTFPSLRDGSGDYAEQWGLTGYPESFVLDREGKVTAVRRGPVDQQWVDEQVVPLLGNR